MTLMTFMFGFALGMYVYYKKSKHTLNSIKFDLTSEIQRYHNLNNDIQYELQKFKSQNS